MTAGFTFTATESKAQIDVPYIEDARANFAPYYSSRKTVAVAQSEVVAELDKLGAESVRFEKGHFDGTGIRRYGYRILFWYGSREGMIRAAGLPIRIYSEKKVDTVCLQALLNVRDWVKASVTAQVFSPGTDPLISHLLVDGERTVADYIADMGQLPQMNPSPLLDEGGEIAEGEIL